MAPIFYCVRIDGTTRIKFEETNVGYSSIPVLLNQKRKPGFTLVTERTGRRDGKVKDLCPSVYQHNGSKSGSLALNPQSMFFCRASSLRDCKGAL